MYSPKFFHGSWRGAAKRLPVSVSVVVVRVIEIENRSHQREHGDHRLLTALVLLITAPASFVNGAAPRRRGERERRAVILRFDLLCAPRLALRPAPRHRPQDSCRARRPPCTSSGQGRAPRDVGARHVIFRDAMVAGARPDVVRGKRCRVAVRPRSTLLANMEHQTKEGEPLQRGGAQRASCCCGHRGRPLRGGG